MIDKREVLDHGFVELVDVMGDDYRILQSARVSTGGVAKKGDSKDKGLIRYLYKNEHLTPFEQVTTTWHVKAPIFVLRQWMRHRTWSFNEYSGRYSEMIEDMYIPNSFFKQSVVNHQGSGEVFSGEESFYHRGKFHDLQNECIEEYKSFLQEGMAKEQARMILPVSQYSELYGTVSLRNLFHFLELRLDEHAQWETRQYAEAILSIMLDIPSLKWSMSAFLEFNELKTVFRQLINKAGRDTTQLKKDLENLLS